MESATHIQDQQDQALRGRVKRIAFFFFIMGFWGCLLTIGALRQLNHDLNRWADTRIHYGIVGTEEQSPPRWVGEASKTIKAELTGAKPKIEAVIDLLF
ncbi:MAG: hypothetical protein Q8Q95_00390 [bacterium]|nr:hypothetical protein [bacterium]